ncbi:MAG: acyl-CoA reductase [Bacteroidota bacterium]
MTLDERIDGFSALKAKIEALDNDQKEDLYFKASNTNPWFTNDSIDMALEGIKVFLEKKILKNWTVNYDLPKNPSRIGIVMAGNIPLVGFHDFLCVLITGNTAVIKLSSQDSILLKTLVKMLIDINEEFQKQIEFVDTLPKVDAVIATGSDNSARYFKKYFSDKPHIIRKNRISIAILEGSETEHNLELLGKDIFSYFGLGCRNVAKILIPEGYNMQKLLDSLQGYSDIANHAKYFNNYEYNKAIYLVNQISHLDTGFALFTENNNLTSPLSVIYYEEYKNKEHLNNILDNYSEKLQCIVSNAKVDKPTVPLGQAQFPEINDYADNVDTMEFLCSLDA